MVANELDELLGRRVRGRGEASAEEELMLIQGSRQSSIRWTLKGVQRDSAI